MKKNSIDAEMRPGCSGNRFGLTDHWRIGAGSIIDIGYLFLSGARSKTRNGKAKGRSPIM